jgi:sucrose-phosphate synthase
LRIAFLNPQGNFDPTDRGWTEHPDFGGQLVYVKEVALALGRQGHLVDILTRQVVDERWREFAGAADAYPDGDTVRILRFPCGPPGFLAKEALWPVLSEWVEHIAEFYEAGEGAPEVLTAHYGDGGVSAVLLQERLGLPFTFTAHSLGAQKLDKLRREGDSVSSLVERFRFDKRLAAERVSMARAAKVIASTTQERLGQYGHPAYRGAVDPADDRKFWVIPPGVNLEVFDAAVRHPVEARVAEKLESTLRRDLPESRRGLPLVISSSRLDRKKNHVGLVRAWGVDSGLLAAANLVLILRGSPDPIRRRASAFSGEALSILDEVATVIEREGLEGAVVAFDLDSQAELAACYRLLAQRHRGVFCLPALFEPFGLALLEAMAAGLPVVATDSGGPSESLREGEREFGILVDPLDPSDIARGLRRLVTDEHEWRRFGRAGRKRVRDRYTWEQTATGYMHAFKEILRGGGAPDPTFRRPVFFADPARDDLTQEALEAIYPLSEAPTEAESV